MSHDARHTEVAHAKGMSHHATRTAVVQLEERTAVAHAKGMSHHATRTGVVQLEERTAVAQVKERR
ncbi:MAG TPA: hypothetical protein VIV11_00600 [Kofleriaceae bacterium]